MPNWAYILIIAALILCSSYFSATETAFSSLNRTRLRTMADKGDRRAARALALEERYDQLLSTILVGNNLVNIAMATLATILCVRIWGDLGATVSTVVITVLVLIFGEVTPKSIAKESPERFAMFSAPFIGLLMKLCAPVNALFSAWKRLIFRLMKPERRGISQEELLTLVNEVEQQGSIDENEGELLRNVIEFTDLDAEDILTHRVDLVAVPVDAEKEEVARVFRESKFSRLLVYEEDIDEIIGVLHQKDFYVGSGIAEEPLRELLSPVVFVLRTSKLSVLLRRLQENQSHVAVVLDEYGGTYGIVTMEDILEELVGEIWDEHDEVEENFRKLDASTYRVQGSMELDDFSRYFRLETGSEMSSLGGWIMEALGRLPEPGDSFCFGNYQIKVLGVENRRVGEVEVRRLPRQLAPEPR